MAESEAEDKRGREEEEKVELETIHELGPRSLFCPAREFVALDAAA
jgi:hypothetical protein